MAEDTNINVNGQNEGANGGAGDNNNNNNNNNGAGEGNEPKTYTQEEVDKLLQSEADRRVSEALKKQAKKNEEKVREAEKLAKMSADEKYEYELEQREKAIQAKEKELALAENKNVASKILADKGLSLELVDFVIAEDAETMKSNIDVLARAFKKSVKAEVEKRLGSPVPKKNLGNPDSITREQFNKMSLDEQSRLYQENPEIYKALVNR